MGPTLKIDRHVDIRETQILHFGKATVSALVLHGTLKTCNGRRGESPCRPIQVVWIVVLQELRAPSAFLGLSFEEVFPVLPGNHISGSQIFLRMIQTVSHDFYAKRTGHTNPNLINPYLHRLY